MLLSEQIIAQGTKLSFWLQADSVVVDSKNRIRNWDNIVDPSVSALQIDTVYMPKLTADTMLNNCKAVEFAESYLSVGDTFNLKDIRTGFFLLREDYSAGEKFFFSKGKNEDGAYGFSHRYSTYKFFSSGEEYKINKIDKTWALFSFRIFENDSTIVFYRNRDSLSEHLGKSIFAENDLPLTIGRSPESTPSYFKGALAEIQIFEKQLTQIEFDSVYEFLNDRYAPKIDLQDSIIVYNLCDTAIIAANKPWFSSYEWSNGAKTSSITVSASGYYAVTVADVFGRKSNDSVFVLFPEFVPLFDTAICRGDSVKLSAIPHYNYMWNTGSHEEDIYAKQGDYFCALSDSLGCIKNTDTVTISHKENPLLVFPDSIWLCKNELFYAYEWFSGNVIWNENDTTNEPKLFFDTWNYCSYLENGCLFKDSLYVSKRGTLPKIEFSIYGQCENEEILFQNYSSPPSFWIVENDTISDSTFARKFPAGTYTSRIKVADSVCTADSLFEFTVFPTLNVAIETEAKDVCINTDIQFNAIVNEESETQWFCESELIGSSYEIQYGFDSAGKHTVSLIADSDSACPDTAYTTLAVYGTSSNNHIFVFSPINGAEYDFNRITFLWDSIGILFSSLRLYHEKVLFLKKNVNVLGNFQSPPLPDGDYFLIIESQTACNEFLKSDTIHFSVQSLCNVEQLALWLSADNCTESSDNYISKWMSATGDVFAEQSDSSKMPILTRDSSFNNHAYLSFSNNFLSLGDTLNIRSIATLYMLVKESYSPSHKILLSKGKKDKNGFAFYSNYSKYKFSANNETYTLVDGLEEGHWALLKFSVDKQNRTSFFCRNGVCEQFDFYVDSTMNNLPLYIGDDPLGASGPLEGGIAECLIFTDTLSKLDETRIMNYFKKKYSIPFSFMRDSIQVSNVCDTAILKIENQYSKVLWSTGEIADSIIVQNTDWYGVTVSDGLGFSFSDSVYVKFRNPPSAIDTIVCQFDSVLWSPCSKQEYYMVWNDGSNSQNKWINAEDSVWFIATDSLGCQYNSDTSYVRISAFATIELFSSDTLIVCAGEHIVPDTVNGHWSFLWNEDISAQEIQISTNGWQKLMVSDSICDIVDSVFVLIENVPDEQTSKPTIVWPQNNEIFSSNIINVLWENTDASIYEVDFGSETLKTPHNECEFTIFSNGNLPITVSAISACGDTTVSDTIWVLIESTANELGIALWLRADTLVSIDSNSVFQWKSMYGNSVAKQETVASQPTIYNDSILLNKKVLTFSDSYLSLGDTFNLREIKAFFILMKETYSSSDKLYFSKGKNASGGFAFTNRYKKYKLYSEKKSYDLTEGIEEGSWSLSAFMQYADDSIALFYRNGITDTIRFFNDTSQNDVPFYIGDDPLGASGPFEGSIAEIIIFNRELSENDFFQMISYFQNRYCEPVHFPEKELIFTNACNTRTLSVPQPWFKTVQWSTDDNAQTISINSSGWYSVTATDYLGNISSDSVFVSIQEWEPILLRDTVICLGDTIRYSWNNLSDSLVWSKNPPVFSETSTVSYTRIDNGCVYYSDTAHIFVDTLSAQLSLGNDTILCKNNKIQVQNFPKSFLSIQWNTGDTLPYLSIDSSGTYSVQVLSENGCLFSDSIRVSVQSEISVSEIIAQGKCVGDTIRLSSRKENSAEESYWIMNADTLPYSPIEFIAEIADTLHLSLVHENADNCISRSDSVIVLHPLPNAFFNGEKVCQGTDALFENKSTISGDSIIKTTWIIETDTLLSADLTYMFQDVGKKNIRLSVETNAGCSHEIEKLVEVFPSPDAHFTFSNICIGKEMVVEKDSVNPNERFFWIIDSVKIFEKRYEAICNREKINIYLQVQNEAGCISTNELLVKPGYKPTAEFIVDSVFCQNEIIIPQNTCDIEDGVIERYIWTFQDDTIINPYAAFLASDTGSYTLRLEIVSSTHCADAFEQTIHIKPQPVALFEMPEIEIQSPVELSVKNNSSKYTSALWKLNDSEIGTDKKITYTIAKEGKYNLSLIVQWDSFCSDTLSHSFYVYGGEPALFIHSVNMENVFGYIITTAEIVNSGKTIIEELYFERWTPQSGYIREKWIGELFPSDTLEYQSSSHIFSGGDIEVPMCFSVLGMSDGDFTLYADTCFAYKNELQILGATPNPVKEILLLSVAIPLSADVNITVLSIEGNPLEEKLYENESSGLLKVPIDFSSYTPGNYFVKVQCRGKVLIKPVLVVK